MTITGSARGLLLFAGLACSDVGTLPKAPAGYQFAYATPSCAPYDGPATTVYLSQAPVDAGSSLPPSNPYVYVSVWIGPDSLPGFTFQLPENMSSGVAGICDSAAACMLASTATVRFRPARPDGAVEGTLDLTFPGRSPVSGGFVATRRDQRMLCG